MNHLFTSVIVGLVLAYPSASFGGDPPAAASPKEECEALMNTLMPFARQMLSKHHAFFPFGATLSPSGKISATASTTGNEHPDPNELIAILEDGFRDGAKEGRYKATALAVDIKTIPLGKKEKQDAVEIRLDHRDGYSVRVVFPYAFSPAGELMFDAPFATAGAKEIFGR